MALAGEERKPELRENEVDEKLQLEVRFELEFPNFFCGCVEFRQATPLSPPRRGLQG
jgi:hypothetical protein